MGRATTLPRQNSMQTKIKQGKPSWRNDICKHLSVGYEATGVSTENQEKEWLDSGKIYNRNVYKGRNMSTIILGKSNLQDSSMLA